MCKRFLFLVFHPRRRLLIVLISRRYFPVLLALDQFSRPCCTVFYRRRVSVLQSALSTLT